MGGQEWAASSGILVYLENRDGRVLPVGLELIGEALRLAEAGGGEIYGIAVGSGTGRIADQMRNYPLKALYLYETEEAFQADRYEQAAAACIHALKPAIVLIGGTAQGRALAPRIAVAFRTGLTADCTQLQINEANLLVQIRPAFGGNIMASILTEHSRPQIATVRPGIFSPAQILPDKLECVMINHTLRAAGSRAELLDINRPEIQPGIDRQELLVVAGRGVRKKEDLELLRELAARLGGQLASSRALVEKGWMQAEQQIGLSGITVSPQCMLTFGVSGTVQFMAGMKHTPNIIAVNNDPNARIFEIAHYPVCADLYEVIPELLKQLE